MDMQALAHARTSLTAAKIALRHAADDLVDSETATMSAPLEGKNAEARKQEAAERLFKSHDYQAALAAQRAAQDAADRAEVAVQVLLDEWSAEKQRTRAKLADVLWALHGTPNVYGDQQAAAMTLDDLTDTEAANAAIMGDDYVPGAPSVEFNYTELAAGYSGDEIPF